MKRALFAVLMVGCLYAEAQTTPPAAVIMVSSNGLPPFAPLTTASGLFAINFTPTLSFVPMCSSTGLPPFSQCTFGGGSSGLSGMTAGQIPVAATATTVTSSVAASTTVNGQTCALGGSCTVGSSLMPSVTPTNCTVSGSVCSTTGTPASITLATIPGTFENLILTCTLQVSGTLSSGIDTVNVTFNGDTGADYNYGKYGMYGSSSIDGGHGQSSTSIIGALGAQDGTLSSQWATSVLTIGRYAQTSGGKTVVGNFAQYNSGVNQVVQYQTSGNWNSGGAAITSITLTPVSGHNFAAGSRCTLDGQN